MLHRRYLTWASVGFALVAGPTAAALMVTFPLVALTQVQSELPSEPLSAEPHFDSPPATPPAGAPSEQLPNTANAAHNASSGVKPQAELTSDKGEKKVSNAFVAAPEARATSTVNPKKTSDARSIASRTGTRRLLATKRSAADDGDPQADGANRPGASLRSDETRRLKTLERKRPGGAVEVARGQYVTDALNIEYPPPRCEGVYVYIISDWGDGRGLATMALGKKGRGYPKRVGARIGQYKVAAIGPSGHGAGPVVWLNDGGNLCQAAVFDDNPARKSRYNRQMIQRKLKQKKLKQKRKRLKQKRLKQKKAMIRRRH